MVAAEDRAALDDGNAKTRMSIRKPPSNQLVGKTAPDEDRVEFIQAGRAIGHVVLGPVLIAAFLPR